MLGHARPNANCANCSHLPVPCFTAAKENTLFWPEDTFATSEYLKTDDNATFLLDVNQCWREDQAEAVSIAA